MSYYQRQRYCEPLAQGSQLAERLACKLSTGKLSYRLWEHFARTEVRTSHETPHLHNSFGDIVARCPVVLWCSQLQDSFPGSSAGKEPACQCRRYRRGFALWVGRIPWRRKWQPTPEWSYQLEIPGHPTLGPRRASTDIFQKRSQCCHWTDPCGSYDCKIHLSYNHQGTLKNMRYISHIFQRVHGSRKATQWG